jgi:hypothetical protein
LLLSISPDPMGNLQSGGRLYLCLLLVGCIELAKIAFNLGINRLDGLLQLLGREVAPLAVLRFELAAVNDHQLATKQL